MPDIHRRKCWDCGNVAEHTDSVVPAVLCHKCGSQDTRRIKEPSPVPADVKLLPCPFCGKTATVDLTQSNYVTIGCPDIHCRGCHPMSAVPPAEWKKEVDAWNARVAE